MVMGLGLSQMKWEWVGLSQEYVRLICIYLIVGNIGGALIMVAVMQLQLWWDPPKYTAASINDPAASGASAASGAAMRSASEGSTAASSKDGDECEEQPEIDVDEAGWLDVLAKELWPNISEWIKKLVKDQIQPKIEESLPSVLAGSLQFAEPSLGKAAPDFGPLVVQERHESGAIELELGIKMLSDITVGIKAMGVYIGVEQFRISGTLTVLFWPPMDKPPFFGGLEIFFSNPPDVFIHFHGAARIAEFPGLRGVVRGIIANAIAQAVVLPRRIAMDLNEDDDVDVIDLRSPNPLAVLSFTLYSGNGLVAADWSLLGGSSSDPFVIASLGCTTWASPVALKTLNPVWGQPGKGVTTEFMVHSEKQLMQLQVFDADIVGMSDLIGQLKDVDVDRLTSAPEVTLRLQPGDVAERGLGAGQLKVSARMMRLSRDRGQTRRPKDLSSGFLAVKLLEVRGLPEDVKYPLKVCLSCGSRKVTSGASSPKPPMTVKNMSILKQLCCSLHDKGYSTEDIMEITQLDKTTVQTTLLAHSQGGMTRTQSNILKKEIKQAMAISAATNPQFNDCIQLLIADPLLPSDPIESVSLDLLDKTMKVVASVQIPVNGLLTAPNLTLRGPFRLTLKDSLVRDGASPELVGSITMRWLR